MFTYLVFDRRLRLLVDFQPLYPVHKINTSERFYQSLILLIWPWTIISISLSWVSSNKRYILRSRKTAQRIAFPIPQHSLLLIRKWYTLNTESPPAKKMGEMMEEIWWWEFIASEEVGSVGGLHWWGHPLSCRARSYRYHVTWYGYTDNFKWWESNVVLLNRVNLELFASCKDFLRFHCLTFGQILEMKNDSKINPLGMVPIKKSKTHVFT